MTDNHTASLDHCHLCGKELEKVYILDWCLYCTIAGRHPDQHTFAYCPRCHEGAFDTRV